MGVLEEEWEMRREFQRRRTEGAFLAYLAHVPGMFG